MKLGVIIGRFQPFHVGHEAMIRQALDYVDRLLIFVGSADQAPSSKNPFPYSVRREMIENTLQDERITVLPAHDFMYDDRMWESCIAEKVMQHVKGDDQIILIGHNKDESSYYLTERFKNWNRILIPSTSKISATEVRSVMYAGLPLGAYIKTPTAVAIHEYIHSNPEEFQRVKDEFHHLRMEAQAWLSAPYPPVFVTADAIVTHKKHVLLIRRGQHPGRGLLAIPGGFINQNESWEAAARRELLEETGLDATNFYLTASKVFDDPSRSLRGRVITKAFHFIAPGNFDCPIGLAGDDADAFEWHHIGNLNALRPHLHDDHWAILRSMLT